MRYAKLLVVGFIAFMMYGCGNVFVSQPIGQKPYKVEAEDWEGTWFNPDGSSSTIKVLDGENGILEIAWIEDSDNTLKLESYEVYLRDSGQWILGSMKVKDNSDKDSYFWGRIEKEERQIIFWRPDLDKFENLVKEGKLPGKINAYNVILGDLKPEHLEIITSEDSGVLFCWDKPLVLMKLTK